LTLAFIGDYAILVKCGMSHFQALFFNFLAACACFIGFYIGVSLASNEDMSFWIFALIAGMFYYVALVDLVRQFSKSKSLC
jgi:zinc transporter 12